MPIFQGGRPPVIRQVEVPRCTAEEPPCPSAAQRTAPRVQSFIRNIEQSEFPILATRVECAARSTMEPFQFGIGPIRCALVILLYPALVFWASFGHLSHPAPAPPEVEQEHETSLCAHRSVFTCPPPCHGVMRGASANEGATACRPERRCSATLHPIFLCGPDRDIGKAKFK